MLQPYDAGALLLKIFGTEEAEVRRFRLKATEMMELALEQNLVGRWFQMLLGLFEAVGPAMIFAVGGWSVIQGRLPLGTVVASVPPLTPPPTPA